MNKPVAACAMALTLTVIPADAITPGPELVPDPGFEDASSWYLGVGASGIENGPLIVNNHSGLILPDPGITTLTGVNYQYERKVDFVNNTDGNGLITLGGQTIRVPGDDVGVVTGSVLATADSGLVFNYLSSCAGRAEFDPVSVRAILSTPLPPVFWLLAPARADESQSPAAVSRQTDTRISSAAVRKNGSTSP